MASTTSKLLNPRTRGEQIQGVCEFYSDGRPVYGSIIGTLQYTMYKMFMENNCTGYHANVVRAAYKEYIESGAIAEHAEPYFMENT